MNKSTWRAVLAIGLSLFPAQAAFPQPAAVDSIKIELDERIPAADLLVDFEILRRSLEALHPGLFRYNDRASLDAAFEELRAEFARDRTLAEAYRAISIFAAKIRCGHTYANFFNQGPAVKAQILQHPRVPFYFRWLGDRMIVTRSFAAEPQLRPGAQITEINGTPVSDILKRLMSVARADGGNDAKRASQLEVTGEAEFEAFDVYFPLFFPWSAEDCALAILDSSTGQEKTLQVPLMTHEQRLAARVANESESPDAPLWKLEMGKDSIGYWRMPSWVAYEGTWNWRGSISEIFDELIKRDAPALIIDVRGNEGGTTEIADEILARLIREPVNLGNVQEKVRFRTVPEDLLPYLNSWDPSFRRLGQAAEDQGDGFFRLRRESSAAINPQCDRFAGKVFVLVDAANSSATFRFASLAQQHGLATLVGQPTGGNQRGINGGAMYFLLLPKSQIELDIPLIGYFPEGRPPDAGLTPDVIIVPTIEEIADGRDAVLDKARELARPLSR
jgi:C-terminal processing protease CtpA/Prc